MKALFVFGPLLVAVVPATAQPPATTPTPVTTSATLSLDSSIEALMAHSGAKAVVLATLPDIEAAPGYDQFKVISLRKLQPHSGGKITDENLAAIDAGLKALPAK